jgi:anti-anti-sigma factor
MHLEIDATPPSAAVKVVGDLDFTTTAELTQRLDDVITMTRRGDLIVDVAGVDFVDSTGMQALLVADRRCRDWGMRMIVRSPSAAMRSLLSITGLDAVLTIDPGRG